MLHKLILEVKEELAAKLFASGLELTKTQEAMDLAREVVSRKISEQMAGGNTEGLMDLFHGVPPLDQSTLVKNMVSDLEQKLCSKTHTPDGVARSVSEFMVPFLMNRISHVVNTTGHAEATLQAVADNRSPLRHIKRLGGNVFRVLFL
ncbi:MAG: hypothetical protein MUC38_10475 [Cyclobacteriaceae bacterium]|jgi:hypothetical protein|nr:hypothetical protein [Cyclobacteriaceae bacterium]